MGAAYVHHTNVDDGVRTNTTLAAPTGLTNNDVLVLVCSGAGGSSGLTLAPPAGFTLAPGYPTVLSNAGTFVKTYVWWKVASGESGSYTVTHASLQTNAHLVAVRGGDTTAPLTPNASLNQGTGTTSTAPGVTTTVDDSFVMYWSQTWRTWGSGSPPTGTTPTFTERRDRVGVSLYIADGVLATAGATGNKSNTNPNVGAEPWAAGLVVVKPPGGTGPVAQSVTGTFVASTVVARVPTLAVGPVTVTASTRASTAIVHVPTLTVGTVAVQAPFVTSTAVVTAATIIPGAAPPDGWGMVGSPVFVE